MHVIGLDVGTTSCKAIVFDLEGNQKGYGFCEYGIICEKPGWAEQDSEKVWDVTRLVISQAVAESGMKDDIKAISLSVQGDAIIPVDKDIKPLHNALLGMDYRAVKQAEYCADLIGDKNLFRLTGMRAHPMNSITKILWFKENAPRIYEKTFKFMTYADFILAKLGAVHAIDFSMASRTMAFDLNEKVWSTNILSALEVDTSVLSKAVESGTVVGEISNSLAEELGLPRRVLLVTGGHDQTCAALGAGIIKENIALDSHGTAEVLSTAFNKPVLNDSMFNSYYPCYLHVKKGMFFTFSLNHIGGILFNWYRNNLGYEEVKEAEALGIESYKFIESKAPREPSSILVMPHFNGSGTPWCDLNSKGAILGLTMNTTRHDIVKGIFDSLTYELKINIDAMRESGIKINELRCVGGVAKSPFCMQIKADITGCSISTLKIREAACLGAAILAAAAVNGYSSLNEGVSATVSVNEIYLPNDKIERRYNEKYNVYKDIYKALKDINKRLGESNTW